MAGNQPEAVELLWGNCGVSWCKYTLAPALTPLCNPDAHADVC